MNIECTHELAKYFPTVVVREVETIYNENGSPRKTTELTKTTFRCPCGFEIKS